MKRPQIWVQFRSHAYYTLRHVLVYLFRGYSSDDHGLRKGYVLYEGNVALGYKVYWNIV